MAGARWNRLDEVVLSGTLDLCCFGMEIGGILFTPEETWFYAIGVRFEEGINCIGVFSDDGIGHWKSR